MASPRSLAVKNPTNRPGRHRPVSVVDVTPTCPRGSTASGHRPGPGGHSSTLTGHSQTPSLSVLICEVGTATLLPRTAVWEAPQDLTWHVVGPQPPAVGHLGCWGRKWTGDSGGHGLPWGALNRPGALGPRPARSRALRFPSGHLFDEVTFQCGFRTK